MRCHRFPLLSMVILLAGIVLGSSWKAATEVQAGVADDSKKSKEKKMEQVSGIGGVFIYANDPASLAKWYEKHLGIKTTINEEEGVYYHRFAYRHDDDLNRKSSTTWAILPAKSKPLIQSGSFMINYHVENLDKMLDQLKEMGVKIEKVKTYDYGKFAWITDPAGNRIELYQEKR